MIPAWVDRRQYPFEPHSLDVGAGTMRYVDEGTGPPIVMVHGTPTWSFLYRDLVKGLRDRYRCVAPDLLGFGLSDKPVGASYRPEDQAKRLGRLIDTLGLKDITLMVHDFGGPIGLSYAIERPANVKRLVLFNTWMWSFAGDRQMQWIGRAFGGRVGRFLYEVRHAGQRRDRIARIPALLVWGMKDPAFAKYLPRWRSLFAHAEVVELPGVGHAPMEERAPEIMPVISRFLEGRTPS